MCRLENKRFYFSAVDFESVGGNSERFLSGCLRQNLRMSQINPTPYGFTARIPARQYRLLHKFARKEHCRLRIRKRIGLYFKLRFLGRHIGVMAGAGLAVILMLCLPGQLWNIEYYGLSTAEQQLLSDELFSRGICQGSIVSDRLLRHAEQQILIDADRFAALSLNFTKGKLIVEAQPTVPKPQKLYAENTNILASDDGVVHSVSVFSGTSAIKAGQVVHKGDVLVKNEWTGQDGVPVASPCRASIMAYVEKNLQTMCPLRRQIEVITGVRLDSLALCFGSRKIWLKKGSDPEASPLQHGLHFMGMSIPLTLYSAKSAQTETCTVQLTREEARTRCIDTLNALLYARYPTMQVLSRKYLFEEKTDGLYCTLMLRAYVDIAAKAQTAQPQGLSVWEK